MRKLLGLGLVILLALNQHSALAQKAGDRKANKASVEKIDELAFGHGVLCNTEKQMQRFLTLYRNNSTPEAAVQAVNTEVASPGACGFAFVAFVPGYVAGTVNCTGGVMRMMQITVLARKTERGWVKVIPTKQFTALFDQAEEA